MRFVPLSISLPKLSQGFVFPLTIYRRKVFHPERGTQSQVIFTVVQFGAISYLYFASRTEENSRAKISIFTHAHELRSG